MYFASSPRPPLMRAGRTIFDGSNVFARCDRLKYVRATLSSKRRMRRSGHARPSSSARDRINVHAAKPTSPAPPPTRNPRRVSRRTSRSTSLIFRLRDFEADDHRAEVVPAGANDLRDVHDEEHDVADRQPEVHEARAGVAAEKRREPAELHRLVDGGAAPPR